MKKAFTLLLVMAMLVAALLPMSVQAATELKNLTITMELPDPGKAPATTATCGTGYTIHGIDWKDSSTNKFLEPGEKIQGGRSYYVYLWVEAKDGYRFASIDDKTPNVNVTVNGKSCTATKAYEYIAPSMVYVAYPITIPTNGWIRTVDLTIPAPQAGAKPSYPQFEHTAYKFTNMVALPEYVNGINWTNVTTDKNIDPNTTFQAGAQYSVNITIEQKSGYAFVPQPVVKVNGQTASASLDYGTVLFVKATFPTLENNHTHTPSDWRTTGMYHYKVCTECGDMLDQEDHRGGKATCTEKAKCQVCGTAYGQNEPEHTWSPTYLYQTSAGHAWICAVCKEHSTVIPHEAGPAGTPDVAVVCKDCGYIITPAKDHKHNLTKVAQVPATCLNPGTIEYYTCDGCSDKFADPDGNTKIPENMSLEIGALGHSPAERWKKDTQYHWHICTTCGQVLDETKMLHEFEEDSCTTCGYRQGDPIEANTPEKNPQRWLFLAVVGVIAAGAGIGLAVILTRKKH